MQPPGMSDEDFQVFNQVAEELQEDLASRSSNSRHIIAEKSGHFIQYEQPELVIDAIRDVVNAVQSVPNGTYLR